MTKKELESLNAELITLLVTLRDQIDDALQEFDAGAEDDDECVSDDDDGSD